MKGLDDYITGHGGEDQFVHACNGCDKLRYIDDVCRYCEKNYCNQCLKDHEEECPMNPVNMPEKIEEADE